MKSIAYPQTGLIGSQWKNYNAFRRLLADDAGQDLVEYGLIAGFIALGALTAMHGLANKITNSYGNIGTTLTSSS